LLAHESKLSFIEDRFFVDCVVVFFFGFQTIFSSTFSEKKSSYCYSQTVAPFDVVDSFVVAANKLVGNYFIYFI
jgi:hypothetical protein